MRRYRTANDVRNIPNEQWEHWHHEDVNPCPWFYPTSEVQMALRYVMQAHLRRIRSGG